ncbi:MAG: hypothetical protein UX10_C0029G0008 [Candidatus Magasanikbacteria bacterium GW2011_GWA2_45_39]|uniref:DUF4209 domain-containing protein n=1 Tax=Candidatus Magasanikbacteria bacterium GW2011_GWA2_45_39 TaxID=1619041 RepID=A0A0G1PMB3_9BACT|nr:MAG: hypothetical protein UX10_C0029G0008 [Candidatus Magasanikbacteria bacterium GW2011_GWA2_45_39]
MKNSKIDSLGEKIKIAKKAATSSDFFLAAIHYKDALVLARDAGDSLLIKECKKEMVEMNKKAEASFKQFNFEQKIPNADIDKVIKSVVRESIIDSLRIIGIHPHLYPKFEEIRATAQKNQPVMLALVSHFTISQDGHVVKGGSNAEYAWLNQIYSISQGLISGIYLNRIFEQLEKAGLNEKGLLSYLKSSKLFPEENFRIIEVGVSRYFAKDYVSSLHILVPQFESVFLFLSEKLGIDVIALNRDKDISTQMKLLSADKLDAAEFQNMWGKDLCAQLKFVLFDQLGYNLRHKIAHGFIKTNECNIEMAHLLIYFYLVVVAHIEAGVISTDTEK